MRQSSRKVPVRSIVVCSLVVVGLLAACAPKDPAVRVAEARGQYFIEPTGMLVQKAPEPEVAEEVMPEEAAAEAVATAEEAAATAEEIAEGEGGEEMAEEPGPRTANVLFDLIIRFDGSKSLPGVTLDVVHSDPFEKEKARYLQWIETDGMRRGDARQLSFEIDISNYVEGDAFAIEFQSHVPPEKFGDYREFAEAAP